MLKILQARLQQYMNRELPDVQGPKQNGTQNLQQPFRTQSSATMLSMMTENELPLSVHRVARVRHNLATEQ